MKSPSGAKFALHPKGTCFAARASEIQPKGLSEIACGLQPQDSTGSLRAGDRYTGVAIRSLLSEGCDIPTHSRSCWVPKPPLCKGRWRGAPEGLMQSSWLRCAKNDCSMSKNPAVPSRKPLTKSKRWGTIPQSAKLTAPFTQRGLWCGAPSTVPPKIAHSSASTPLSAQPTSPLLGETIASAHQSLPCKGRWQNL